ncbi:MAG: hypothetical protein WBQ87_12065, partial [Candidatus Sulfotelmatobacter sp.]
MSAGLATGANADLVGQTLASRLKSLWTDESGEMKIPGTGSDAEAPSSGSSQGRSATNHNVSRIVRNTDQKFTP